MSPAELNQPATPQPIDRDLRDFLVDRRAQSHPCHRAFAVSYLRNGGDEEEAG